MIESDSNYLSYASISSHCLAIERELKDILGASASASGIILIQSNGPHYYFTKAQGLPDGN